MLARVVAQKAAAGNAIYTRNISSAHPHGPAAVREICAAQPIFDYHCHLSPRDIAENRQFKNLFEIWLAGDHYKWRAMRANGVAEEPV